MTRPRVGIVGAGQLGRMLALAGYPLGIDCTLLDTSARRSGRASRDVVLGELDDPAALAKLADRVDVVTLEIENVAVAALESLRGRIEVFPPPAAVAAAQDRLAEKTLFRSLGIPTAEFVTIDAASDAAAAEQARLAGDLEDAAHGLRRPRPARRRLACGARRGVARARQRAVDRRGVRAFDREVSLIGVQGARRRTRVLPARRRTCIATAFSRARGAVRRRSASSGKPSAGSRRSWPTLEYRGVLTVEFFHTQERPRRERDGAARPQLGPLDHRGRRDEPVREPLASRARLAARRPAARGHAAMLNLLGRLPPRDSVLAHRRRASARLRQEPATGSKSRPLHARGRRPHPASRASRTAARTLVFRSNQ